MPSLYSRLREFVRPDFDTMTTLLLISLSRSRHVPGDNLPRIPVGYRAHAAEVLKRYAPDKNQAMQYMVSCQTICQMKLELRHLAILEPVVGTSADLGQQCLPQINASSSKSSWLVSLIYSATNRYYANVDLNASARIEYESDVAMHTNSNQRVGLLPLSYCQATS